MMVDASYVPNKDEMISWARRCVAGSDSIEVTDIVATRYSYVAKLQTDREAYYLKYAPGDLFIEVEILNRLAGLAVPNVIDENAELSCFLTKETGNMTLKTYFNGVFDVDLMAQGFEHYITVQNKVSQHLEGFRKIGVPEWTLENYPNRIRDIIHSQRFKAVCGTIKNEQRILESIAENCERVTDLGIENSLNHCDFHDNNILISTSDNRLSIIDWGETAITHPMMSRYTCLEKLRALYGFDIQSNVYQRLENLITESYDLDDTARHALRSLCNIYYAFTYNQLIRLVGNAPDKWYNRIFDSLKRYEDAYP